MATTTRARGKRVKAEQRYMKEERDKREKREERATEETANAKATAPFCFHEVETI